MEKLFPDKDIESATPFLRQYLQEKARYPDSILFFRMGDFYETFYEDAELVSEITGITLTSKPAGNKKRVPLAGVPIKAAQNYINTLISDGQKVAICEQLEPPGGKLIKRKVVRVITPGNAVEPELLNPEKNLYICSVNKSKKKAGIAFCEVASGEFYAGEVDITSLEAELKQINPAEILIEENSDISDGNWHITKLDRTYYSGAVLDKLKNNLGVVSLQGFGIEDNSQTAMAAASLFEYLSKTTLTDLNHIRKINHYDCSKFMSIDDITLRNLEIIQSSSGDRKLSLAGILDFAILSSGKRKLRRWLRYPLIDRNSIEKRLNVVEELLNDEKKRGKLRDIFKEISDPQRLSGRIGMGNASIQELVRLKKFLKIIPEVKNILHLSDSELLKSISDGLNLQKDVLNYLENSISDDVSSEVIKKGFNDELDKLKEEVSSALGRISTIEGRERERTGISSLKVKYNALIGYFIEVTKSKLSLVPDDYRKKQWLSNSERFTTDELDKLQNIVIDGQEKIKVLEDQILQDIKKYCSDKAYLISENGELISQLDVLTAFAVAALKYNYIKPEINEDLSIELKDARHPVVEQKNRGEDFIPNDLLLSADISPSLVIITGPNMAGKSTYLRQTALLIIMAQAGSFVPADKSSVGIVDKIFSRIGASDDISKGISTFMTEMIETANILNNVTKKSLVILDEIGRGTSTFDGLSIAWSVAEYIYKKIGCRTMFATHYHELAGLSDNFEKVQNLNVAVARRKGRVIFLRKVIEGYSSHSYGIEVAKLAGLPLEVIVRAEQVLNKLERSDVNLPGERKNLDEQPTLFSHPVLDELKKIKTDDTTPIEALNILSELRKLL